MTNSPLATQAQNPTPIALTEQAGARVVVLDSTCDWIAEPAALWSWRPDCIAGAVDSWGLPNDVRLRQYAGGRRYVLVSDSYGYLAQIRYPEGGEPVWSVDAGRDANPHGIDLLPDGSIAAAASTGGWVRVYAGSKGAHCGAYAEAALAGAHQVLWDDSEGVLWGLGDNQLVRYEIGGATARPTITPGTSYDLPTHGGHDLQPVPGEPGRLWITTVYGVHQFDVPERRFITSYPRHQDLYATDIKSIGTDPQTGTILRTMALGHAPRVWCTDRVDLFVGPNSTLHKVLPGAQIYRARWFDFSAT